MNATTAHVEIPRRVTLGMGVGWCWLLVLAGGLLPVAGQDPEPQDDGVVEEPLVEQPFEEFELLEEVDDQLLTELARILGDGPEWLEEDAVLQEEMVDPGIFGVPRMGMPGQAPLLSHGQVKTDTEAETLIDRANAFAREGRYDLASRLWQEAITESSDALMERPEWRDQTYQGNTYYRLRPMIEEVENSMAETIEGDLDAYRLKVDGEARVLLARSTPETREAHLAEVILRYFLSSVGDDAAFELGCLKMERGEFIPAVRLFQKILQEYPQPSVERAEVEVRLAGSLARTGDFEQALRLVEGLEGEYPERARILQWVRQDIEAVRTRDAGQLTVQTVLTTPAGVQPSLAASRLPQRLETLWTQAFELRLPADWPVLPESPRDPLPELDGRFNRRVTPGRPPANEEPPSLTARWREGFMPVGQVIVHEGRAYFKTDDRLVACETDTGTLLWLGFRHSFLLAEAVLSEGRQYSNQLAGDLSVPKTPEEFLLFGDTVNQSMTLAGDVLYVLQGEPLDFKDEEDRADVGMRRPQMRGFGGRNSAQGRFRRNRLVAYDADSGKLLWYRRAADGDQQEFAMPQLTGFSRAPLPYGSLLLVPVHEDSSLWLTALERDTGELAWRTFLCDEPPGQCQALSAVSLEVEGGQAFVGSGAGLVFAVDAVSGQLNWAVRYPRVTDAPDAGASGSRFVPYYGSVLSLLAGWPQDRILSHGKELMVAPTDFDQLFALDRRTGELSWETPRVPFRSDDDEAYVLAEHGGFLYTAGGQKARCYSVSGGKLIWETAFSGRSYARGAFTPEAIYIPLEDAVLQLDAATGAVLSRAEVTPPAQDEPVGNLFTDGERLLVFGLKKVYALGLRPAQGALN